MGFNSGFKGLKYFISTVTCFSASAPFSGGLNFVVAEVTNY